MLQCSKLFLLRLELGSLPFLDVLSFLNFKGSINWVRHVDYYNRVMGKGVKTPSGLPEYLTYTLNFFFV